MAARKSSLRDLAAKSRKEGLAAANPAPVADRIAELDPALVHAGGLEDRIDVSAEEIATLSESLRKAGQKVPILVRPHPSKPGEYEIVAGRRRLAACRLAGLQVRAEIQDLDDKSLVMTQAIENIARLDLTYIERARLAVRMVDEAGVSPEEIDTAFSCGKTDRSRYLKIGRAIPHDFLSFVGKAPGIGRPRWEKLVAHMLQNEGVEQRMRDALAAANTQDPALADSDARFSHLFEAAFMAAEPASPKTETSPTLRDVRIASHDKPLGTIKRSGGGVHLVLKEAPKPGFLDWLDRNVEAVIGQALREYENETRFQDADEGSEDEADT